MNQVVICYLPLIDGKRFSESTWGLVQETLKLKNKNFKCIGVLVHTGVEQKIISTLPFDEVYYLELELNHWKLVNYHMEAFRLVMEEVNASNGIYLFSSHPIFHETAVRLSVRDSGSVVTNVIQIFFQVNDTDLITMKREIYNGKGNEYVTFSEAKHRFITMEESILYSRPIKGNPILKEIRKDLLKISTSRVHFVSQTLLTWKDLKITEASCVIGIGRGVSGASTESIIQLAELLNAPIGGSKVADELGLIPREKRIGSSGSTISADIYIAIGISGSSQHIDGIKNVKHIVAINNDPSAPIFQRAELGIIGDFQEVVPQLILALEEERQREENDKYLRSS